MLFELVKTDGSGKPARIVDEEEVKRLLLDQYKHTDFLDGLKRGQCASVEGGMLRGVHTGIELIASERARQIEAEGWTPEHDAEHHMEELAIAAMCYAKPSKLRGAREAYGMTPGDWPWSERWWKPSPGDRVRELAKAGALIAAEIDRLQRVQPNNQVERQP